MYVRVFWNANQRRWRENNSTGVAENFQTGKTQNRIETGRHYESFTPNEFETEIFALTSINNTQQVRKLGEIPVCLRLGLPRNIGTTNEISQCDET